MSVAAGPHLYWPFTFPLLFCCQRLPARLPWRVVQVALRGESLHVESVVPVVPRFDAVCLTCQCWNLSPWPSCSREHSNNFNTVTGEIYRYVCVPNQYCECLFSVHRMTSMTLTVRLKCIVTVLLVCHKFRSAVCQSRCIVAAVAIQ